MYKIIELETDLFGLKYRPSLIGFSNDDDFAIDPEWRKRDGWLEPEFTKCNQQELKKIVKQIQYEKGAGIIEIGVARNPDFNNTSTRIILENKPKEMPYLGIDIKDRSHIHDKADNVHTIIENSFRQETILKKMAEIGINNLALLFIDGWHSVNTVINDFKYAKLVKIGGFVGFHDTNWHPGPNTVFDAIDEKIFKKERLCVKENDWGIGIAQRIQ